MKKMSCYVGVAGLLACEQASDPGRMVETKREKGITLCIAFPLSQGLQKQAFDAPENEKTTTPAV